MASKATATAPKSEKTLEAAWNKIAQEVLIGKTVTAVRYMTEKEADEVFLDGGRAVVITFNDGTEIYPSIDEEGNGGGALFCTNAKTSYLPVLR